EVGVDGLKLHPLHVVKHTKRAIEWKRGEYVPLTEADYVRIAADLIERTPDHVAYHRVTGTSPRNILLAPEWASKKWSVLNGIEQELRRRDSRQGAATTRCGGADGCGSGRRLPPSVSEIIPLTLSEAALAGTPFEYKELRHVA
ncbi:MAG: hypothetical protein V1879_01360, partial [Pseudomonadota bacterium]